MIRRARGAAGATLAGLVSVLGGLSGAACDADAPGASDAATPAPSAPADATDLYAVTLDRLLRAEQRRTAAAVLPDDQHHRDPRVRRIAARALARIGGEAARAGLLRALSDEDAEVVGWAAYGLGFQCRDHRAEDVSALASRALSLPTKGFDEAFATIARAIGQCGADTSESTLAAWLKENDTRAAGAALGLGDLASLKKRLREDTLVALLSRAEGSAASAPLGLALFPFSRLDRIPPSVVDRLVEVAGERLSVPGEDRVLAIRALGRGNAAAADALAKVLATPAAFDAAERAGAIGSLAKLGGPGQTVLAAALLQAVPDANTIPSGFWMTDEVGVLLTLLDALDKPTGKADKLLRELAAAPLPAAAPAPVARRVAWVRCRAAVRVVGGNYVDPLLLGCDVAKDDRVGIGERAAIEVLGRRKLTDREEQRWKEVATKGPLRAREAAIELAAAHVELSDTVSVLVGALGAKELGLVGVAAEAIAAQPLLAADARTRARIQKSIDDEEDKDDKKKEAESKVRAGVAAGDVVKALLAALDRSAEDPEVQASVIGAIGALALREGVGPLEPLCASSYPVLRERAESALFLITGKKQTCAPPEEGGSLPAELDRALQRTEAVGLILETDVGELRIALSPEVAPITVQRVVDLALAGYYDDKLVHRVVPGFVSQFGAPEGDGYGGAAGKPPLRCETSPRTFERLHVGVALAGRDTGSSQLFVTHTTFPHLDGRYAWVGTAEGSWSSLVDGDRVTKATIATAAR